MSLRGLLSPGLLRLRLAMTKVVTVIASEVTNGTAVIASEAKQSRRLQAAKRQIFFPLALIFLLGSFSLSVSAANLPDFRDIGPVKVRRQAFYAYLRPKVDAENQRILATRLRIQRLHRQYKHTHQLTSQDKQWLLQTAEAYHVSASLSAPPFWHTLLSRVDVVPDTLALAQADKESALGTSRFAREGNNVFGQWCYRQGCGMTPRGSPNAKFQVRRFDSVENSIQHYMRNLNTHRAYVNFRILRAEARQRALPLDAWQLAAGLLAYSQEREAYVRDLRLLIRRTHWTWPFWELTHDTHHSTL